LSRGFEALGDRLNIRLSGLNSPAEAEDCYRKALQAWKEILAQNPKEPKGARALAVLTMKVGDIESIGRRSDAAWDLYAKALETITSADQQTPENLRLADIIRRKLASLDSEQRPAEALKQYRVLIASRQSLVDQDRKDPRARMDLAVALLEAGEV